MDINCLTVSTFQTESGEVLVNTEAKVGDEDIIAPKAARQNASQLPRWSDDKPVREVVLETVQELTGGDTNTEFAPKEISTLISEEVPRLQGRYSAGTAYCGLPQSRVIS